MIPSISWKNVWRNKVRSLVVIAAITLGLFGGLFGSAIYKGMGDRRVHEALTKEISHLQIHNPKYLDNPEIGLTIKDAPNVVKFIESQKGVKAVSSRVKINSMISSSVANSGVTVLGIDPLKEKTVTEMYKALYTPEQVSKEFDISDPESLNLFMKDSVGNYFENVSRNPILIGEELAHTLKVKVRSKLVLTFQNIDGSLTGGAFRVVGIFRTENSVFEEMNVFVRQNDLDKLCGLEKGTAHELAVFLEQDDSSDDLAKTIRAKYPYLEVNDWREIQPDIAMLNDLMTVSMTIVMVIILLALGFGIVNTMLMVVLERVKEIGMLMAIGMSRLRIFTMIILESVMLCLTGAATGIGISILLIEIFRVHGIDLTAFAKEGFEALGFGAVFYPSLNANFYILVTLLVVITGILSSVYPALKALKLNPADALRTD